jgi:hypothetical protein
MDKGVSLKGGQACMSVRINRRKVALTVTAGGVIPVVGVGVAKWAGAGGIIYVGANGQPLGLCTLPFGPDGDRPVPASPKHGSKS